MKRINLYEEFNKYYKKLEEDFLVEDVSYSIDNIFKDYPDDYVKVILNDGQIKKALHYNESAHPFIGDDNFIVDTLNYQFKPDYFINNGDYEIEFETALDYIDNKTFNLLKELGCTAQSIKEIKGCTSYGEFLNLFDDVDMAEKIDSVVEEAYYNTLEWCSGDACRDDIIDEFKEVFSPLDVKYDIDEGLIISGTKSVWEKFILKIIDTIEIDDYSDLQEIVMYYLENNFDLQVPKNDWYTFDYNIFIDELYKELKKISLIEGFNNYYEKLEETILNEGTRYDEQASKIISNSGLFNEEVSKKIIDALYREDIHAFVHSPNWLEKYLKGIARMLVEESRGNQQTAQQFLTECPSVFNEYLTWIKENREKLSDEEKKNLDNEFINSMKYQEVKDFNKDRRKERSEKSSKELANMKFEEDSNYTLVPINSYEEMNRLYGGRLTGSGNSGYAGDGQGGTAWCHTNSKSTYDDWVKDNNKFYVLQRNDFKDIPFNPITNKEMKGKDDYGNSLIAILVDEDGELLKATLRCNHVGVPSSADNQYKTYADLSKIVGFNVEDAVLKDLGVEKVEKEIRVVTVFGKECRIQKISKDSNYWDFLDLPIRSKVYDTWDIAKKYNSNHDGKNNNLDKLIPQIKSELEKNNLKIGKIWIPSKEEYEDKIPFYSKQKNRIKFYDGDSYWYWTSTPDPDRYGDWYSVGCGGLLNWYGVNFTDGVSFAFEILE